MIKFAEIARGHFFKPLENGAEITDIIKPVKSVANDCGFDDVSYFCSIFKRFEKVTPGDFRKLYHA